MDDWVQIISRQWYITLSTHDITWFCCELNELRKVYYVIWPYRSHIKCIYILLNKVVLCGQNFHQYDEHFIKLVLLSSFLNISISTLWSTNNYHVCQQQDVFLFYVPVISSLLSNPYISNISNPDNPKKLSLASQTICDHIFSYS